jgi:hypothetical protein
MGWNISQTFISKSNSGPKVVAETLLVSDRKDDKVAPMVSNFGKPRIGKSWAPASAIFLAKHSAPG